MSLFKKIFSKKSQENTNHKTSQPAAEYIGAHCSIDDKNVFAGLESSSKNELPKSVDTTGDGIKETIVVELPTEEYDGHRISELFAFRSVDQPMQITVTKRPAQDTVYTKKHSVHSIAGRNSHLVGHTAEKGPINWGG